MTLSGKKIITRTAQILLLIILAYFIVPVLIDGFRGFNPADWKINYFLLILSLLLMQIVLYCQSAIWAMVITFFGKTISLNKAFKVAYLAQLGRYIPGKIWQLFGMIYLARKEGISKEEATLSAILTEIFTTPPGLLVTVLYLFAFGPPGKYAQYGALGWIAVAIVIAFSVIFFLPQLFKELINFAIKLIRQPEVGFQIEKKVGMKVLIAYFITWNLYGISFYLFLLAILPGQGFNILEIIGAWTLAYLVGYWAVILPGGLGAREGILIIMLSPIIGQEKAGIVVIGARAWSIVGEVVCTVLAWRVK